MNISVKGYTLKVDIENKVVRLTNNSNLKNLLKNESSASLAIALELKKQYKLKQNKALNISELSIAIEICGHVHPDKLASAAAKVANKIPLVGGSISNAIRNAILSHTDVIDIGESSVDTNRWLWDALAAVLTAPPVIV